ncbi:hypothetical protein GCM10010336_43430 [Streptomyces goshikiensis]|nr:hypothetical protein GCM10010336_43430 [Streptomyces goshikiensis]
MTEYGLATSPPTRTSPGPSGATETFAEDGAEAEAPAAAPPFAPSFAPSAPFVSADCPQPARSSAAAASARPALRWFCLPHVMETPPDTPINYLAHARRSAP